MRSPLGRRYLFILFCLLSISLSVRGEEIETVPTEPHEKAAYFMRKGKMDEAISIYHSLAAAEPGNVDRQKELMWAYWHANRYHETAGMAMTISHLAPNDIEVLNLLARAQTTLGQRQAAIWTYQKSLAINPDQLSVLLAVARLHIDLKDFDTASKQLADLQTRYPQEANIYADQARIAFIKGNFPESLPLWTKSIELAPDNFLFKLHEIETLYRMGQMTLAHQKLRVLVTEEKNPWPAKDRKDIWALLETVPAATGAKPETLHPYAHPMGIDEVQIGQALGRLYTDLRDYDAAADILLDLRKRIRITLKSTVA